MAKAITNAENAPDTIKTFKGDVTDSSSNHYTAISADGIGYDAINEQLLLKVDGADTVIPFRKNTDTYSYPSGSNGGTVDLNNAAGGKENHVRYVNASNVYSNGYSNGYNNGVTAGKNANNISINNPYLGYISGNTSQDRSFTNPFGVAAKCYVYNGGASGVSDIRIYVNGAKVADSGSTNATQTWSGVVGAGGTVRMTHSGAGGSEDRPCEVSLVWAAAL